MVSRRMALLGQNRNELASSAFILESDDSIGGCEQAVVATAADVLPRLNTSSTLSDDDRPTGNQLATVALNAKSLGIAITAVTATTLTFFVCHYSVLRKRQSCRCAGQCNPDDDLSCAGIPCGAFS